MKELYENAPLNFNVYTFRYVKTNKSSGDIIYLFGYCGTH